MILEKFIVLEGIDGSGTSTQLQLLKKELADKEVVFTNEPTERETGKFLRTILKGDIQVDAKTAAHLFAADRCEHLYGKAGIVECTQEGKVVVCDRYLFSSLAYQSTACGKELPRLLNGDFPLPEIVFFFDIDPEISLQRITGRGVTEIYEKHDFLVKTADAYRAVFDEYEAKNTGMKIVRVDATQSINEVFNQLWQHIEPKLV